MHPLNTRHRRRLLSAAIRLERRLSHAQPEPRQIARERLVKLLRGDKPWNWLSL